ncbi:MAG: DUF4373 domain-containing protein [Desulfobacterales bacterium]
MARPKEFRAKYFPHECQLPTNGTVALLEDRFGNDGYAVWFKTLQMLGRAENHYLDLRNVLRWRGYLKECNVSEQTALDILDDLVVLDAIDADLWKKHKIIWCYNFIYKALDELYRRKDEIPMKPVVLEDGRVKVEYGPNPERQEDFGAETEVNDKETPVNVAETPVIAAETAVSAPKTKLNKTKLNETEVNNNSAGMFLESDVQKRDITEAGERIFLKDGRVLFKSGGAVYTGLSVAQAFIERRRRINPNFKFNAETWEKAGNKLLAEWTPPELMDIFDKAVEVKIYRQIIQSLPKFFDKQKNTRIRWIDAVVNHMDRYTPNQQGKTQTQNRVKSISVWIPGEPAPRRSVKVGAELKELIAGQRQDVREDVAHNLKIGGYTKHEIQELTGVKVA